MVDFTEPIDINTIYWNEPSPTFTLREYLGIQANGDPLYGNPIPGKFEFLNDNSRVIFRPDENLKFSQTGAPQKYVIILTADIMDVSQPTAMHLQNIESATFTTAIQPSGPSITYIEKPTGVIGDEVIISGKGFDPDPALNIVLFAGRPQLLNAQH